MAWLSFAVFIGIVVGMSGLAVTGFAYRSVYIVLVPLGLIWFLLFGLAANIPGSDLDRDARQIGTEVAMLGVAVATGGFFGGILFRKRGQVAPEAPQQQDSVKKCPDCAEFVREDARKCRFCGHQFGEASSSPPLPKTDALQGGAAASSFAPRSLRGWVEPPQGRESKEESRNSLRPESNRESQG
jgi:hypothetical protein